MAAVAARVAMIRETAAVKVNPGSENQGKCVPQPRCDAAAFEKKLATCGREGLHCSGLCAVNGNAVGVARCLVACNIKYSLCQLEAERSTGCCVVLGTRDSTRMKQDMLTTERTGSFLSTVLAVTGGWSLGHLLLLWRLPRGEESAWVLYGGGVLGGLAAALVGAVVSRVVAGREGWVGLRKAVLVVVGFLPPATAGLMLLFASGTQEPSQAGASNSEALAAAIGAGLGNAIGGAVTMVLGFGAGAVLAGGMAWFAGRSDVLSHGRRISLGLTWLIATAVGVTVFLYVPGWLGGG